MTVFLQEENTDTEGRRPLERKAEKEGCIYKPRIAGNPQSWKRQEGSSPGAFRGSVALPTS